MANPFIAGTQYGDPKGTVSFDGHGSPPLLDLAKLTDMPAKELLPIDFALSQIGPDESGNLRFSIAAISAARKRATLSMK